MASDSTNFHAGCHSPVPLRGLFQGRISRKRSRTIDQSQGRESTGFQSGPIPPSALPDPASSVEKRVPGRSCRGCSIGGASRSSHSAARGWPPASGPASSAPSHGASGRSPSRSGFRTTSGERPSAISNALTCRGPLRWRWWACGQNRSIDGTRSWTRRCSAKAVTSSQRSVKQRWPRRSCPSPKLAGVLTQPSTQPVTDDAGCGENGSIRKEW